jgi:hypothetical protein
MWEGSYVLEADRQRMIEEEKNPYEQVPYAFRYNGLGRIHESGDPFYLAVSALQALKGELMEERIIRTAMSAAWLFHVFPRAIVKGEDATKAAKALITGPGAVIALPDSPNSSLTWLEQPQPNQQMMDHLRETQQALREQVSPALGGQGNATAGIHEALQIGQATKRLTRIKTSTNLLVGEVLTKLAGCVKTFDISMNVRGTIEGGEQAVRVSADTFKNVKFSAKFEVVDPAENDRRMMAGLSVYNAGSLISRATFRREFLGHLVEDSESEEAQILLEQTLDALAAAGVLSQSVMGRLQLLQNGEQVAKATQAATQRIQESTLAQQEEAVAGSPGLAAEGQTTAGGGFAGALGA